jgi:hypothetical protein
MGDKAYTRGPYQRGPFRYEARIVLSEPGASMDRKLREFLLRRARAIEDWLRRVGVDPGRYQLLFWRTDPSMDCLPVEIVILVPNEESPPVGAEVDIPALMSRHPSLRLEYPLSVRA